MPAYAVTGNDFLILGPAGALLPVTDFAHGKTVLIEYPNDAKILKTGKGGSAVWTTNADGSVATLTVRMLEGGAGDIYFQSLFNTEKLDPPAFPLLNARFVKRIGDGLGGVKNITHILQGGKITKPVGGQEDLDGDSEQAVATWVFQFPNGERIHA